MKNQYLAAFIASVFLVACTTTPKSNNYSYTETGRWIASAKEKADAKASAIMFLADQAISSCEAVQEILSKIQEQENRGAEVQISEEDIKEALLKVDDEGNVSLRNNPDCKNKIYALAQVMCDGTNNDDPLCEAVNFRKEIDRSILQLQTADSATAERIVDELSEKIKEQELALKHEQDKGFFKKMGTAGAMLAPLGIAYGSKAMVAVLLSEWVLIVLGTAAILEAGISVYSLVKALNKCRGTDIERCRRTYFARTHNTIWEGVIDAPITIIKGIGSAFRRGFERTRVSIKPRAR